MPAKLTRIPVSKEQETATPSWPAGVAAAAVLATLLLYWGWSRGYDARVIGRIPAVEREKLFQLTRNKAEALCGDPDLEEQCRSEVDLLSKFPECGAECQQFVVRHRPHPSR